MLRSIGSVTFLALLMVGCGGGGGDSGSAPPPPPSYTVGGTVTGLTGSGLVLQTNAGDLVAVSAAVGVSRGHFTFANQLGSGAAYAVTVKTQPSAPVQNCTVTNGSGTVGTANVTTVAVACSTVAGYTIRGTVSGLQGSGLVLQIFDPGTRGYYGIPGHPGHSVGPPLQITSNGRFTIVESPPTASNALLAEISQQPASPYQPCLVHNAIDFQAGNVTNVEVGCSQYAYVANAGDSTISAYAVDATSGALAAVGMPVTTGMSPHAIVGTDDRTYVFVGNEGSNDVSAFAVNFASGALTPVPGSPFAAGADPKALALYGRYLYVANAGSDTVSVIDAVNAAANAGDRTVRAYATGKGPSSLQLDGGGFLYAANNGGSNDISAFAIDLAGATGALFPVPGSPFPAGGNPLSLALGAGGKFLYAANPDATHPSISGFSIDPATGALSPLSGSPFPLPVSHYIATDQNGAYLYVTTGATIVGYAIDTNTGALTALPGFPVSAGVNAYSLSIDPTNQFLYVANDGAANVSAFRLDAATGSLTPITGSPFAAGYHPDFIATF
jgi:6-phosphogluconolactonase